MLANKDNHTSKAIKEATSTTQKDALHLFELAYKKVTCIGSAYISRMFTVSISFS